MYTVFGDMLSGNCYKVKLLMQFLGIEHTWQHVDILAGETHHPTFLQMNANGKIPVLAIDDERYLCESNAILNYLANGTYLLPEDNYLRAQVLQWQFFEQYSHEPFIAVARYINKYLGLPDERHDEYHSLQFGGIKALNVMERHLDKADFFVGTRATIADISLYAYTHVSHEGGFSLDAYRAIRRWLGRIETLPGYVEMERGSRGS